MKIRSKTTLTYNNEQNAKLVFDSLDADNKNYLKSEITKNNINYEINSNSPGSFLATIDDLIASEIVVEKIIYNTKK